MEKVLVIGASLSGEAVSRYLSKKGYDVYLTDIKTIKNRQELMDLGIHVFDNGHPDELVRDDYAMVIKNPGIKYTGEFVRKLLEKGYTMLNEIEIALNDNPQVRYGAITGTNGKTTTTTMLGELLKTKNPDNVACGNIGLPLCDVLSGHKGEELELSIEIAAFQLLGCPSFHPYVSVIMNLTPDHVDYFGNVDAYYKAKTLVYRNQKEGDYFLKNMDDEVVREYCTDVPCIVIEFSLEDENTELGIRDGYVCYGDVKLFSLAEFKLPGKHNVQNAMVACCMAYLMGVSLEDIRNVIENFRGVEHRLEFVEEINGVRYYNDSKGTNVDSTVMALKSFNQPIHLLVGGYDKKTGFDGLKPYLGNVKKMYAYGTTREQFIPLFGNVELYNDMFEALDAAEKEAVSGEIILLSPACASWDQFPNFEVRGELFKQQVREFAERFK